MSWGIEVQRVRVLRVSKSEMAGHVLEAEAGMQRIREKLIALAATAPRDEPEGQTWEDRVVNEVPELLEEFASLASSTYVIRQGLENPDEVSDC